VTDEAGRVYQAVYEKINALMIAAAAVESEAPPELPAVLEEPQRYSDEPPAYWWTRY
jgi:hypothetical protein